MFSDAYSSAEKSKKVLAALPSDPARGSYYWWARIARTNTGAHFLDSGGAYGRTFESPAPPHTEYPVKIEYGHQSYRVEFDLVSVDTINFLYSNTDACGGEAENIEKMFYWFCNDALPEEAYYTCIEEFARIRRILSVDENDRLHVSEEELLKLAKEHSNDVDVEAAIKAAMELEAEFVSALGELPDKIRITGDNIYNSDNDLSQVFQFHQLGETMYDYTFIQVHTGCDVRGGYTSPVVVQVLDGFWTWQVDFFCRACEEQFYDQYDYKHALEKFHGVNREYSNHHNRGAVVRTLITRADYDTWMKMLEHAHMKEAGQLTLPGVEEFEWPADCNSQEVIEALCKLFEERMEEDDGEVEYPDILIHNKQTGTWKVPTDKFGEIRANECLMLCPECGGYDVVEYINMEFPVRRAQ